MTTNNDIVKTFTSLCGEDFPWKGKWISDEEWAKHVQPDNTILLDINVVKPSIQPLVPIQRIGICSVSKKRTILDCIVT